MPSSEQPLIKFWSCHEAPETYRSSIPHKFRDGWVAVLPPELFRDVAFAQLLGHGPDRALIALADGSGLAVGLFGESAAQMVALLSGVARPSDRNSQ